MPVDYDDKEGEVRTRLGVDRCELLPAGSRKLIGGREFNFVSKSEKSPAGLQLLAGGGGGANRKKITRGPNCLSLPLVIKPTRAISKPPRALRQRIEKHCR